MTSGSEGLTEQQLQAKCVRWFSDTYPAERGMLHCNNNNSSNRIEGNRNKALGVVPGVSDLELILKGGRVVFIELKISVGVLSEDQIKWSRKIIDRGHIYMTAFSFEEFTELIKQIYE